MQKKNYDKIINRLRQIRPVNESPNRLTDEIMLRLKNVPHRKKSRIYINANAKQWKVIYGFRVLMTSAALILTGFFIYQEYELGNRTREFGTMEIQHTVVESTDIQPGQELMQWTDEDTGNSTQGNYPGLTGTDSMDRNTLASMLKLTREIKNINRSNRQRLQLYISDPSLLITQKLYGNENTD